MIWYLLYPFRRTTEAPVLSPNHPLRKAFFRYGRFMASHVTTCFPISVLAAFLLIYPMFFLYTTDSKTITNGASNLPHHVWTDAQPLQPGAASEPDVIMRSIWVHGSYMQALEQDVLLGALELQDELLGPTKDFNPRAANRRLSSADLHGDLRAEERDAFHIIHGLTNESWFFHSPLQYWSGSAENIAADDNILSTVNKKKNQSTTVNTTLRHSIVFSGKRFEDRHLVAADALVITLLHRRDSPVGRRWVERTKDIAARKTEKWTVIPPDGESATGRLYQFQFRPMSLSDWLALTVAYLCTFIYVMGSLSRLQAIKSKTGLVISILLQISASIASSFTVCAIFKVDVSKVPSYAFPLVILAISMENSLRLINAVIVNSSAVNINYRIGEAFAETAHIAIANRLGNLILLLILSSVTWAGVAGFCKFAAIAIAFDFFYMSTFFLLALKLDVRQRELSDMEQAFVEKGKPIYGAQGNKPWNRIWHWMRHQTITPTRIAGTMVLVAFVFIANSHAAPEIGFHVDRILFGGFWAREGSADSGSSLLRNVHQARSPGSWLRLQDHETAREVINAIKPSATSYVALVYDPVVFVLQGSDRMPKSREPLFLPAVYDFVHHQIPDFIALSIIVFLTLCLITAYLARDQVAPVTDPDHPDDEPLLSVNSLRDGHRLDVLMMNSSRDGVLATVGLDRMIRIWNVRSGRSARLLTEPGHPERDPFPVLGMAIDQKSTWLAVLSPKKVLLWNIPERRWGPSMDVDSAGMKPEAFFFGTMKVEFMNSLLLVKRNGRMIELKPDIGEAEEYIICKTPLVWAVPFAEKPIPGRGTPRLSILTASRKSCIHLVTQHDDHWLSEEIKLPTREQKDVHSLIPISTFSMYLIARRRSVDLVDIHSSRIIHTFSTEPMEPRTLKQIFSTWNPATGMNSFTLAYVNAETKDLVIQTYLPSNQETGTICSCKRSETRAGSCCPWSETREIKRRVENPGVWEALRDGCLVGVRKKQPPALATEGSSSSTAQNTSGLRQRHQPTNPKKSSSAPREDEWEAWALNQLDDDQQQQPNQEQRQQHDGGGGNYETRPLNLASEMGSPDGGGYLLISELGPMVKVAGGSVAVGFGKTVKIVTVGHEHFDGGGMPDELLGEISGRRRRNQVGGRGPGGRGTEGLG